jgi:hypothetical protein
MANLIKNTTDGTSVLATAQTITVSELISGGSVLPGDILEVISFVKKNVTTSTLSIRFYVNTANNLTGATQLGIYTGVTSTVFGYIMGRNFVVKSATSTIAFPVASGNITPDISSTTVYGDVNIDWSINQYFIVALSHSSGAANDSYSTGLLVLKR